MRKTFSFLTFLLLLVSTAEPRGSKEAKPERLLLILVDGFRHDYLSQAGLPLPGFGKIAERGFKAGAFVPDFPSLSYPNYYSIMTGLHTESHGMTGNYMYDVTRNESFLIGSNPEQYNAHWWDRGDPLWTTAGRQNKTVSMYYWPGCEVQIRGLRPTLCREYSGVPSLGDFRSAVNKSLEKLRHKDTDVAAIYFELIDKYGHGYGPLSAKLNKVLRDLDPIISDIVDRLSDPDLADVNLIILSDHGMTEISPEQVIDIGIPLKGIQGVSLVGAYAIVNIFVSEAEQEQAYTALKGYHPNMTVYKKSDLPERWHYKNGPYVAPLVAVADLGWSIMHPVAREKFGEASLAGMHGFDQRNKDMHGIFLAMGPAFSPGSRVDKLDAVDAYQVMCDILDINASPNNGSVSVLRTVLKRYATDEAASPVTRSVGLIVACFCLLFLLL